MPDHIVIALISMAALWLLGHQIVKQRFTTLKSNLPDIYGSALTAPAQDVSAPQLMALCVDLMRKKHCTVPFDALSVQEKKIVLHAHAVETLPTWMSRYAALGLSAANRSLITQLRQVHSSRPERPKQHFGAIKRHQQLRSAAKG